MDTRGVGLAAACVLAACGPSFEDGATTEHFDWRTTPLAASPPEPVELSAPVSALVADDDEVLFGTSQGLFLQRGSDAPQPLTPLTMRDDEPASTGAVSSVARRVAGGFLVTAASGLYVWTGQTLVRSPVSAALTSPTVLAACDFAGQERVAVVDDERLLVLGRDLIEVDVPALRGPPERLACRNGTIFASRGDRLLRLVERGDRFDPFLVLDGSAQINDLAFDLDGALWVATGESVLRRTEVFGAASWIAWDGVDARALTVDPDRAGVWVRGEGFAARVSVEDKVAASVPTSGTGPMAMDMAGNLWAAGGDSNVLWRQGGVEAPPPSFESRVMPFAQKHCHSCHSQEATIPLTDLEAWRRNGQRILLNLEVGTMPQNAALSRVEYRVVERWVLGGMLP